MNQRIFTTIAVAFFLALPVAAQENPDSATVAATMSEIGQDTDPTKPVFFSLRDEFGKIDDNVSLNAFIFRLDRLFLEELNVPGPARGILARLDIPIVTYSSPSTTETGLGDIYMQALVAPRIQGNFAMAAGTGITLPTATSNLLGRGKWIASPAIVPVWFFPKEGYGYIKFQDWFSFAGQSNRPAVHYLTVTGSILRRISKTWWALLDTESNSDWTNEGHTWFKSGALLGLMPSNRIGVWLKGEIPYGHYRVGDWSIKTSVFVTRF